MIAMQRERVNGLLLVYHHFLCDNAPTIMEHVHALRDHSSFRVFTWNTELGFPSGLENLEFDAVALHYSMFGSTPFDLTMNRGGRGSSFFGAAFFRPTFFLAAGRRFC